MTNTLELTRENVQQIFDEAYDLGMRHQQDAQDVGASIDARFGKASQVSSRRADEYQIVGVQFGGTGQLYTYRWDGVDDLALGDKVYVYTDRQPSAKARVVALYSSDLTFPGITINDVVGRRND